MPVPTAPEPLDALRARYPRALEYVYHADKVRAGGIGPGEVAANVFDFEDGLRLIVSRERLPDGRLVLHVRASFPARCRMADEFWRLALTMPKKRVLELWAADLPRRFRELSGDGRTLELIGWSGRLIPHLMITEEEIDR